MFWNRFFAAALIALLFVPVAAGAESTGKYITKGPIDVDFGGATLSVPSPIPMVPSDGAGVPVPISTPSANGKVPAVGLSVNSQNMGFDGTNWYPWHVEGDSGVAVVSTGGTQKYYIPGGTTAGQIVRYGRGRLVRIQNVSTSAQTNPLSCYDTLVGIGTGNPLWIGTLGAREIVNLEIPDTLGIFCQASSGLNAGVGVNIMYE